MSPVLAIAADGARGGWLVALAHGHHDVERVELRLAASFEELVRLRKNDEPVAVDIPMGLLDTVALRPCDQAARALLGDRRSTVFAPPSRSLLRSTTYADARRARAGGKGLSAQAFGLAAKIREADEHLRADPGAQAWLWECHPELSFRDLAGGRVLPDKKSVRGQAERLRLLGGRFPGVLDALAAFAHRRREAEPADALDALAALHTALRLRAGEVTQLGGERDAAGLVMRIVF